MKTKHQQPIAHQARMRHRDARAVVATRFVRGILKNKTQETGRGVLGHVFLDASEKAQGANDTVSPAFFSLPPLLRLLLTRIRQCGLSFKSCKMASITVQVLPVPGGPKMTYGT